MADIDPDSPTPCHTVKLEQNDKPPDVPEMVSPSSIYSLVTPNYWINPDPTKKTESARTAKEMYVWHNEDLLADLDCDVPDLDPESLEEEVLVDEDHDEFDAFQSDVPRKINREGGKEDGKEGGKEDGKDKETNRDKAGISDSARMVDYLELLTEQNNEMLKIMKALTGRMDILENRLIHALWDPDTAVDHMYKRHGKPGRPKMSWERGEEKRQESKATETRVSPEQKFVKPAKSELEVQQATLMQYQLHKKMMSEAAEREMIERALIESQHVYTRLGMPQTPRPKIYDSSDHKKELGFGEPNKYA